MSDEPAGARDVEAAGDPTEVSRWRPVFRLLSDMDDEIARVYAGNGIEDLKPSWVYEIVRLHVRGPMTIAELARSVGRTHSALSQKVAAMRAAGWLETTPGRDARSKTVTLTPKAVRAAALLAAEWRATEAAISELEAELPYPLSRVAEDIRAALSRKSFYARIAGHLAAEGRLPHDRHQDLLPRGLSLDTSRGAAICCPAGTACKRTATGGAGVHLPVPGPPREWQVVLTDQFPDHRELRR